MEKLKKNGNSYAEQLFGEYRQCYDEGLDVEPYQKLFFAVRRMPLCTEREEIATLLQQIIYKLPMRADYAYNEPSDLEGIRALRKPYAYEGKTAEGDAPKDKISGAWYGRVCGCWLGKPIEGAKYAEITGATVTGIVHDGAAPAGRVAICSGGAGEEIYQMHEKGYGTYLTGEENHWVSNAAQDMGINILFAGHYATETFGVKALGALLEEKFGLPTIFIDNPTGM
jgi:hypothetical protein